MGMMITASLGFLVLAAYIVAMLAKHGIQATVSDTYYVSRHKWLFSAAVALYAGLTLPAMLEAGGLQFLAFFAALGLLLVAAEPHFRSPWGRKIHVGGAIAALACCIGWALSVQWQPVVLIAIGYAFYALSAVLSGRDIAEYRLCFVGECAASVAVTIALLCNL